MIILYKPKLEDLWFREQFMSDPETMSYNHAWGGTIPFPENTWKDWYDHWLVHHDNKRFYRYLRDSETENYIGEIAYHYDEERKIWLADAIVVSEYRGKGYGSEGLQLLCDAAKENGIDVLRDDIRWLILHLSSLRNLLAFMTGLIMLNKKSYTIPYELLNAEK